MAKITVSDEQWGALLKDMRERSTTGYGANAKISNEEIIRNLKVFIDENGRLPKNDEIVAAAGCSRAALYNRVGNLTNLSQILGVPKGKKTKKEKPKKAKSSSKPSKATPVKVDSAKKEQYLDTLCTLAEEKGSWFFNVKEIRKGFISHISEYDEHVVKHFWGNPLRLLDAAKSYAADTGRCKFEAAVKSPTDAEKRTPDKPAVEEPVIAQGSAIRITIEVPRDMAIPKLLESVFNFTDNVVIKVVE